MGKFLKNLRPNNGAFKGNAFSYFTQLDVFKWYEVMLAASHSVFQVRFFKIGTYTIFIYTYIRLMDEILHQHLEIELGQISASPLPPSSMLGAFCHWGGAGFWSFNFFFSDNQTVSQC